MAGDLMWGGVPRILPSDTCLKYQNDVKTKVLKEKDLPTGSHLRATRILEGIRGFKQCKKDISESYDNYYRTLKRMPRDPMKQMVNPENKRRPLLQFKRDRRPGTGLGWTEPRKESFIGCVDRRLTLRGYIGGVKKRESAFADK